jgi:hypothetical protein
VRVGTHRVSSLCSVGHGAAPAPGHTGLRPPPAWVALRVSAPWRRGAPRKRGRAAGEVVQSADSGGAMLLVQQPLWVFGNGRSPAMALRLRRLRVRSPEPTPDRRGLSGSQPSTTAQPTYGGRLSTTPIFYYDVLPSGSIPRTPGRGGLSGGRPKAWPRKELFPINSDSMKDPPLFHRPPIIAVVQRLGSWMGRRREGLVGGR